MSQPEPYQEPTRMTEEERKEFVLGVLQGRIFTSAHLHSHEDPGMVWFPIMFGAFAPPEVKLPEIPEEIPEDMTPDDFEAFPENRAKIKAGLEKAMRERQDHYNKHIGGFWEWHSKALPRSINGLPCFMSVQVMHIEDWKLTGEVILREQERLSELTV